jgi:hypothetical protein
VGHSNNPEPFDFEESSGMSNRQHGGYAVAVTKADRLVIMEANRDEEIAEFTVYDDFDDFKDSLIDNRYPMYPESLIAAVAAELGVNHIEDLDI